MPSNCGSRDIVDSVADLVDAVTPTDADNDTTQQGTDPDDDQSPAMARSA